MSVRHRSRRSGRVRIGGYYSCTFSAHQPPRVLESPVSFECRLTDLIQLKDTQDKVLGTWLILGEVVTVHIDKTLRQQGAYDTVGGQPILRGGGPVDYFAIEQSQRFEIHRSRSLVGATTRWLRIHFSRGE